VNVSVSSSSTNKNEASASIGRYWSSFIIVESRHPA